MIQDGDSVQLPYRWLNSMAYGRYNELFNGVYKPTNITRGGPASFMGVSENGGFAITQYQTWGLTWLNHIGVSPMNIVVPPLSGVCWFINPSYGHIRHTLW